MKSILIALTLIASTTSQVSAQIYRPLPRVFSAEAQSINKTCSNIPYGDAHNSCLKMLNDQMKYELVLLKANQVNYVAPSISDDSDIVIPNPDASNCSVAEAIAGKCSPLDYIKK